MFSIVDGEITVPLRFFDRWRKPNPCAIERLASPRCLHSTVFWPLNATPQQRGVRTALTFERLAALNVTGVVLSLGFPHADLASRYGLAVSTPVPLYRRMAGRLATWAADAMRIPGNRLHVALVASRASVELAACATALRDRAGFLSVEAGRDTEAFCFGLGKQFGVSCTPGVASRADIVLLFDRQREPVSARALVLDLTAGVPAVTGSSLWANGVQLRPPERFAFWPHDTDTPALLAALLSTGSVGLDEIAVCGLLAHGRPVKLPFLSDCG